MAVSALALALGAVSLLYGPVRIESASHVFFKSSGVVRPAVAGLLFGLLAGTRRTASRLAGALLVSSLLPFPAYRTTVARLTVDEKPMRRATDCVRRVAATVDPAGTRGLYVDAPPEAISHGINYYFRRIQPWVRPPAPSPDGLDALLDDPVMPQPLLVSEPIYQAYMRGADAGARQRTMSPPLVSFPDVVLLLPGPYATCATIVGTRGARQGNPTPR